MKIAPFAVEQWMKAYETKCRYNLAETCVDSYANGSAILDEGLRRTSGFLRRLVS
jgi:hypothetical protein